MIIHHMRDGSIRDSIEGMIVPVSFENIYKLARMGKKEHRHDNIDTSGNFRKKQVLD